MKAHSLGQLTDYETKLLEQAIPELAANIKKGLDFVASSKL
jgi:malate dehydrogenase